MNVIGKVTSTIKPEATTIDQYSVWVAKNIVEKQVSVMDGEETHTEYEYDLTQYDKDEYIRLLITDNASVNSQITNLQTALVEVYEMMLT